MWHSSDVMARLLCVSEAHTWAHMLDEVIQGHQLPTRQLMGDALITCLEHGSRLEKCGFRPVSTSHQFTLRTVAPRTNGRIRPMKSPSE